LQTGAWVAGNATQHNYLSHWQEEKKRQEVDGCKDKPLCKTGIEAKWAIISAQQDVGIVVGVGGGIGLSTAETAVGVYELVKNWRETYAALEQLATSPEFRQQFGDNYLKGLEERAAFLTQAYEDAGWQGSVTAGVEGGRFAAELVGVLTAVKGGAQITAKLPTAAKNLVNAIAESPVSGSMSSQLGAVGDLGRLGGGAKATATVIDTAPMAQRVMDVRAGLPSNLRRSGNVAIAEIDIPGIPRQMAAHSQVSDAGKGLIGSGSGNFVAQSVPNKAGDMVYRGIDTEYKILDNIADQLGSNTSARGTVNILTEKAACASCLNVAEQFKAKYPNITVNILDNQGVMLRPPRKTP
ncbi:TPA: hypothetical protein L4H13_006624, partial [Pseudomonas aeruginosa]|nr:hypothetical protein [Pseudomonas aeruginosa]